MKRELNCKLEMLINMIVEIGRHVLQGRKISLNLVEFGGRTEQIGITDMTKIYKESVQIENEVSAFGENY